MVEKLTKKATKSLLEKIAQVKVDKFREINILDDGWFVGFELPNTELYVNAAYTSSGLSIHVMKGTKDYECDILDCSKDPLADKARNNLDKLVSKYSPPSQEDELGL